MKTNEILSAEWVDNLHDHVSVLVIEGRSPELANEIYDLIYSHEALRKQLASISQPSTTSPCEQGTPT